jgi:hypothetical protein
MFNIIDIYSYIPVSGCVGMGHNALLWPEPVMLLRRFWLGSGACGADTEWK